VVEVVSEAVVRKGSMVDDLLGPTWHKLGLE
jgi:hypothetical protein